MENNQNLFLNLWDRVFVPVERMEYIQMMDKDTAKILNLHALKYDRNRNKRINKIIKYLSLRKDHLLLEIGSGFGHDAMRITSQVPCRYFGIDLSLSKLMYAKKKCQSGLFYLSKTDAASLPFKSCTFDVIFTDGSIHHIHDLKPFISEVHRVLKHDGKLAFFEPNFWNPFIFAQTISSKWERGISRIRRKYLKNLLEKSGFCDVDFQYDTYTPTFPKSFFKIYDFIDGFIKFFPIFSRISLMLLITAKKQIGDIHLIRES